MQARHYLAQQRQTVRSGKCGVIVREKLPDVAHGGRAEQRIHDGVREHVGIRMTEQAGLVRDIDAAEDKPAAADEAMHVISVSNAHHALPRLLRMSSASSMSIGVVILMFSSEPCVTTGFTRNCSTAEQSSVMARCLRMALVSAALMRSA